MHCQEYLFSRRPDHTRRPTPRSRRRHIARRSQILAISICLHPKFVYRVIKPQEADVWLQSDA